MSSHVPRISYHVSHLQNCSLYRLNSEAPDRDVPSANVLGAVKDQTTSAIEHQQDLKKNSGETGAHV